MRPRDRWFFVGALVAAAATAVSGQSPAAQTREAPRPSLPAAPAPPPRDATPDSKPQHASIKGRVTDLDGRPLRGATVNVSTSDSQLSRLAVTDGDGRYEIKDLAGGRYQMSASKAGYVRHVLGQRRRTDSGRPLQIGDGQKIDRLDFALRRAAAVTGRVVDELGEPVAYVDVQALRIVTSGGRRGIEVHGNSRTTDDLGQYRIWGLPPGEYVLSATTESPQDSRVSGQKGTTPTFYPATASLEEAQRLTLGAGDEIAADIQLVTARLARISGVVLRTGGRPATLGQVLLRPRGDVPGHIPSQTLRDGTFVFSGVSPGSYVLAAFVPPDVQPQEAKRSGKLAELAVLPLAIDGEDVGPLQLATAEGLVAQGTLVFEGGPPPKPSGGPIRVYHSPADPDSMVPQMIRFGGAVDSSGRFRLEDIWGEVVLGLHNVPHGWMLKSMSYGGVDVTGRPVEIKADGGPLQIVLTNRISTLRGTVTDDRNQPVKDFDVVVFPQERQGRTGSRGTRVARPDQQGEFLVDALRPGDYLIAAFDAFDDEWWGEAAFLDRIRALAEPVTVREGESVKVELKLSASP